MLQERKATRETKIRRVKIADETGFTAGSLARTLTSPFLSSYAIPFAKSHPSRLRRRVEAGGRRGRRGPGGQEAGEDSPQKGNKR